MHSTVCPEACALLNSLDIPGLLQLPVEAVRPLLPTLVRMALCSSLDTSSDWLETRKCLLQLLSGIEAVNEIIALLSVDFHELEEDAKKEARFQSKMGNNDSSTFISSLKQQGLVLEFERSEPLRRLRIVMSEMLPFMIASDSHITDTMSDSELFQCPAYLEDVSDVLCILCAELPSVFKLTAVSKALLSFQFGAIILCKLVANNPESFFSVCNTLLGIADEEVQNQKHLSHESRRLKTLEMLSMLNPACKLTVRSLCVHHCCFPQLAVTLALPTQESSRGINAVSEYVIFITGLLLGNNLKVRSWFASYLRQAKGLEECLLRQELMKDLRNILNAAEMKSDHSPDDIATTNEDCHQAKKVSSNESSCAMQEGLNQSMYILVDEHCLHAAALIRLYCALKVIASLKFSVEESDLILRLITCFPPLTPRGIRFVSLSLGMLLACPALLCGSAEEERVVSWIKWLASRSEEMENVGPEGCSFAEQLLLTAIHLHGDKKNAVIRLACSTLGMRVKVSSASLNKLRNVFTVEVFPTHVVAAHAAKVPVTKNLNASMSGYLPIHCVYQLLKSRAFTQGRIPVKDWIYNQICVAKSPLHPQLQPLIQQYVTTIVTPFSRGHSKQNRLLNEPFEEKDVLQVFGGENGYQSAFSTGINNNERFSLTSKLLMLYYVLLYEDMVLNNMKSLSYLSERPKRYSSTLINMIPVKLLLFKAKRQPKCSQGLYPSLLGLLITHLPHLCLVEDWMLDLDCLSSDNVVISMPENNRSVSKSPGLICFSPEQFFSSLRRTAINPAPALMHLRMLTYHKVEADAILKYAPSFTKGLPFLLHAKVSRRVRQEAQNLWHKLHSVIPRELSVMTIRSLQSCCNKSSISVTYEELMDDPLLPLTVDERIFQCPDLLPTVLCIMSASLSACQSRTQTLLKANPTCDGNNAGQTRSASPLGNSCISEAEKEELRSALKSASCSAAVQLLIELCALPSFAPQAVQTHSGINILSHEREVQCLVCSTLHQMFIADPTVAKLVHFQVSLR